MLKKACIGVSENRSILEILLTFFRAQRLKRSEGSLSESRSRYQSNNMNGANSGVDREREPLISSGGPGPDAQDGTTSDDEDQSGVASILFCLLFITSFPFSDSGVSY